MALKSFQRLVFLPVAVIFTTLLFRLVSGNVCSGDGSIMDTCPEGEYCDGGSCHECSLCSVSALLQGMALTKCLCVPTSHKICPILASGEQLVEHPSQLSFTNWTGYQNIDLTYLKESYNRSNIDCTVPTTTKGPTSAAITTTYLTTLLTETSTQPSSSTQSATKETVCPPSDYPVLYLIVIIVLAVAAVAIISGLAVWIVCLHKGRCVCGRNSGNNKGLTTSQSDSTRPRQGGGSNPEEAVAMV